MDQPKELRSGAVSAEPPAWQPIETAPRDGTKILVYIQSASLDWRIVARAFDEHDGWYSDPGKHHVRPTHWMPLPDPPSAALRAESPPCTCHPDDNPPVPCAKRYALSDCLAVAAIRAESRETPDDPGEKP